jgi:polyisoprenoid-binding protein YceI
MKKITILASAAAALMFSFTTPDAGTWKADASHSNINFSIVHLGISDVDGSFKKFDAKFTSSKEDFTDAVFEFTADVNSISTNDEKRDGHLKSPDFFDVAKFANITFKSKTVKKGTGDKYTIIGEMTMHGVTKLVNFEAVIKKGTKPMSKKDVVGVRISGVLNRSTFGIAATMPATMLSEEVTIKGSAEFGKE